MNAVNYKGVSLKIRQAREEDFDNLWNLIETESFEFTKESFKNLAKLSVKSVVFDNLEIGFGLINFAFEEDNIKNYNMCIYITPKYRRQGYARKLVKHLEEKVIDNDNKIIRIENMLKYYDAEEFLKKMEYKMWFSSSLMTYSGQGFEHIDLDLIPYEDKYYEEYVEIIDEAFYQMCIDNNLTPNSASKSKTLRKELENSKDEFALLILDSKLKGVVQVTEDHISRVMTDKYIRNKGYGRLLVKYASNKIIKNGLEPKLFIMDTNKDARKLYESLDYDLTSTVHVYKK